MGNNLHKAFKNIPEISPASGLEDRILGCIKAEKDRITKRKLLFSRLGLIGSLAVFPTAMFAFGSEILNSEFGSIISLAFSDLSTVAENWQEFVLSLLETLPAISVMAILASVFILLLSANAYLNNISNNKHKYI